jgi:hypothetical protein
MASADTSIDVPGYHDLSSRPFAVQASPSEETDECQNASFGNQSRNAATFSFMSRRTAAWLPREDDYGLTFAIVSGSSLHP